MQGVVSKVIRFCSSQDLGSVPSTLISMCICIITQLNYQNTQFIKIRYLLILSRSISDHHLRCKSPIRKTGKIKYVPVFIKISSRFFSASSCTNFIRNSSVTGFQRALKRLFAISCDGIASLGNMQISNLKLCELREC